MKVGLTSLAGKVVLITGATGLIGSGLLAALPAGVEVFTPSHKSLASFSFPDVDIIIHAAGYGQPARFMQNPVETIMVNTAVTARLLEKLRPNGSFLFCSSSEMYSGLSHPASENEIGTTTPQHPRACYIEGKRCGEAIVNAYRGKGVRASSARIALAYGPGTKKHDARVLNQFIERALIQKRIDLMDSGDAIRTYCYIDDTVEILWDIVMNGTQSVYNVGGVSTVSIAELAVKIGNLTGAEVGIPAKLDSLSGAPREVRMDLSRIREEFGKTEYVGLEDGLKATIGWQRGFYGGQNERKS